MGGFVTNYQAGGRYDFPFMPTKTNPFIKGIRVPVTNDMGVATHTYIVGHERAELVSIAIAASRYEDLDNWSLYVNDRLMIDEIYTKELPEGMYLMVLVKLLKGDSIKFEFRNSSLTSKSVWLNYQMLV